MATASLFESAVNWIRKGYPEGIPPTDFPPLFALLTRVLTDDQIMQIALQLAGKHGIDAPLTEERIHAAIAAATDQPPTQEEINQVASKLAAAGWPLAVQQDSAQLDSAKENSEL
ncbi:MAG: DUF3349 domain-containing protein [Gordonia sp. (in: high G+C Gram-positive bacteria)]